MTHPLQYPGPYHQVSERWESVVLVTPTSVKQDEWVSRIAHPLSQKVLVWRRPPLRIESGGAAPDQKSLWCHVKMGQ